MKGDSTVGGRSGFTRFPVAEFVLLSFLSGGCHASGNDEDHPLGDIGCPVGHAFQVMGDPQQMGGALNRLGLPGHAVQQIAAHLAIQRVNLVVIFPNQLGGFGVPVHPGPQTRCLSRSPGA